jgi:hypothetical protein
LFLLSASSRSASFSDRTNVSPGRHLALDGIHSGTIRTAPRAALVVKAAWAFSPSILCGFFPWLPYLRFARQHGFAALGERSFIEDQSDRSCGDVDLDAVAFFHVHVLYRRRYLA